MEKMNSEEFSEKNRLSKEEEDYYIRKVEYYCDRNRCSEDKAIHALGLDYLKETGIFEVGYKRPGSEPDPKNSYNYVEFANYETDNMPSVRLDDRKVAIQGLMDYFNYMNGKKGFSSDSGRASARNTYTDKTLNNMNKDIIRNISTARSSVDEYYNILMGGDKIASDNIDEKNSLRSDMYSKYGVGHAYEDDRKKLVKSLYVPKPKKEDSKQK